jgi:hypothetical protein
MVPLEAGASPANPPCPACGEPLFGWLSPQPGLGAAVSRCESCGLGVVGDSADPEEALRALDALGNPAQIANRASFSTTLGGAGWTGLQPGVKYLFTVESAGRLLACRDQVVKSRRWLPLQGFLASWQTLLNSVTFGHNVALGAFGRAPAVLAEQRWQRRIDAVASVVAAVPALVVAIPLELAGGLVGRGAVVSVRFELL